MSATEYQEAVSKLRKLIAEGDVRAGLKYLNSLTPHRFTGLYLFHDPKLENKYIVDAENLDIESLPDVPLTATYCSFTRSKGEVLAIENSLKDDRVQDHPAREEIVSYCGVPLQDKSGEIYGTICHFDHESVHISDLNVALLEAVAPLLEEQHTARP